MADVQQAPPGDRYGRSGDARTDRRLKILGAVLGAGLLALLVWFGTAHVGGADVSGSLIKFKVVSGEAVEAHLEVRKERGAEGVCVLRALEPGGAEVGRKEVRVGAGRERVDQVVTVRTTARATSAELLSCTTVQG
jgi:uncharacterized protein (DUF58 family)